LVEVNGRYGGRRGLGRAVKKKRVAEEKLKRGIISRKGWTDGI
jgi:hypothetical protein